MALSRIFVAPKNGQGGVKKSKVFFQKKYSKDGKKIGGPLGPYLQKIDFLKSGGQGGPPTWPSSKGGGKRSFFCSCAKFQGGISHDFFVKPHQLGGNLTPLNTFSVSKKYFETFLGSYGQFFANPEKNIFDFLKKSHISKKVPVAVEERLKIIF